VIVILGILLAIAIPALTGYITKAQDEQYKMDARDFSVAARTVLDEAYAKGDFSANTSAATYAQNGISGLTKGWELQALKSLVGGDALGYIDSAAVLIGKRFLPSSFAPGFWGYYLVGSSTATVASADGFLYYVWPEGRNMLPPFNKPCIVVTYRVQRVDTATGLNGTNGILTEMSASPLYSAEAGYEVYHFVG
jgi:type II secretory pathway pseudopilin PulG